MSVTGHGIVRAAPEHLVHGHAGALTLDVPQRFVHGGDHLVVDRTTAPVRAEVSALPQVFNTVGIPTDQPRFEVLLERGRHGIRLIAVVRRPNALEASLAGAALE